MSPELLSTPKMRTLRQSVQSIALSLLCFTGVAFALISRADDSVFGNSQSSAAFIAEELRRCPLWKDIPPQNAGDRQQITNIYLNLAGYPTEVIRAGIYLYVSSYDALDPRYAEAGYKVFALERVVFKVSTRYRVGERFPYAILGNPLIPDGTQTYINFQWPYSTGNAGQLVLDGFGVGQLSGPPYNPIADFDQMAAHLPRRTLARPPGERR